MDERFTDYLRRQADGIMQAQHSHPFVRGIGSGTLDLARFKVWVRQDYLYLIEFARLFSLASARAPDLASITHYAGLAEFTLKTEIELHRSYAREFGILEVELERERKAPTCQAYTDFLVRTAAMGSAGEFAAAFLPCVWGYTEIAQQLLDQGLPYEPHYAKWIGMYCGPEQVEQSERARTLVDAAAAGQPKAELDRMETAYLISARYEYLFWDMCWNNETWPV